MHTNQKSFYRYLVISLGLFLAVGSLLWLQGAASPAAAQEPTDTIDLSLQILLDDEASASAIGTTPVFNVGDVFKISIVAEGVTDPGIFGSQFEVVYDTEFLQAVDGSLVSGPNMEPVVIAVSDFNLEGGVVSWAASRQGDVENLSGDVVLATLSIEAIAPTEPPEGTTTTIDLQNVKLGAKGGIEVPVSGLVPLDVIIRDDGTIPGKGDIVGNVTVEGRAADNQAGHTVTAVGALGGELSDETDTDGFFFINNAPADTYTLTADSPGFLAAVCEGVAHTMDALTTLDDVNLLAGDIDGSGEIDITDAVAIGTVFGSTAGEVADLNIDGVVDILDLILMAANFGETSEGNPWICELGTEL